MDHNEDSAPEPVMAESDIYFIETFLRQRGDYSAMLAIDELVLREGLQLDERASLIQQTIQGVFNGKR